MADDDDYNDDYNDDDGDGDDYNDDYDDDYGGILKSGNTKNLNIWKDYQTRKV